MKKEYRLTNNSSFSYIFKNGQKINGKFFVLYKVKAANIKIGVSVSKKIGNSVVRNKVKRRIKESFRQLIDLIEGNYNFVIVAKKDSAQAEFSELKQEIINALKQASIYKNGEKE